jgi:hypothetical protein
VSDRAAARTHSRERHAEQDAERPSRVRHATEDEERRRPNGHREADEGSVPKRPRRAEPAGIRAARVAAEHVLYLTGRRPENVVSLARDDDGWQVGVEVMEMHRIPETTDIMAVYEVTLDHDGELVRCERGQRYHRAQVEEEQ